MSLLSSWFPKAVDLGLRCTLCAATSIFEDVQSAGYEEKDAAERKKKVSFLTCQILCL